MFEAAEIDHQVDKEAYESQVPALRERLLEAQYDLMEKKHRALLVLVNGLDGAGKGDTVNVLNEWLDARHLRTDGFGEPTGDAASYPDFWRFWRALPPRGRVGIFVGSWYVTPILQHAERRINAAELDQTAGHIRRFERMLTDERVVLLKFFFHLSRDAQSKRLKTLRKDPLTRWRVTETDLQHFKNYDRFRAASVRVLRQTSTAEAPWVIVPGKDERYRELMVGNAVLQALQEINRNELVASPRDAKPVRGRLDRKTILGSIDLDVTLSKKKYEKRLERYQGRLNQCSRDKDFSERSVVVVFEGWDAAGKGGAIRRLTHALDARKYRVIQVAAPTEEERVQPYLWRFWRRVPGPGRFAFFDRSWYGRVLVERVEKFATEGEWRRAYGEINEFEEQLIENGTILLKFWLHISKDEQLKRFRSRSETGFKRYKLTDDDWRNREKWPQYTRAVEDMVTQTSTEIAPWTLVSANDKYHARIEILRTITRKLEVALKGSR